MNPESNKRKSKTRLCIKSMDSDKHGTPVYLNVYDLTPVNGYFYWAGLGVFHTGVEVFGVEYAFGAHDYPTSGVFEIEPQQCPGFKFRKSIYMGTTYLDSLQVRKFMEYQSSNFNGDSYHLVAKNCNHFCDNMCQKLIGKTIPKWINRLARIGSCCNCILPEGLKTSSTSNEKKRLRRSSFSFLSSISVHQREKEMSISSLFLHSHYKGFLSSMGTERFKKQFP